MKSPIWPWGRGTCRMFTSRSSLKTMMKKEEANTNSINWSNIYSADTPRSKFKCASGRSSSWLLKLCKRPVKSSTMIKNVSNSTVSISSSTLVLSLGFWKSMAAHPWHIIPRSISSWKWAYSMIFLLYWILKGCWQEMKSKLAVSILFSKKRELPPAESLLVGWAPRIIDRSSWES